jgi:hypothetical protein
MILHKKFVFVEGEKCCRKDEKMKNDSLEKNFIIISQEDKIFYFWIMVRNENFKISTSHNKKQSVDLSESASSS